MPTAYIRKLAKLNNISIDKIENLWSQAKEIAKSEGNGKAWGLITTIFQNKLKEKGYKIKAYSILSSIDNREEVTDNLGAIKFLKPYKNTKFTPATYLFGLLVGYASLSTTSIKVKDLKEQSYDVFDDDILKNCKTVEDVLEVCKKESPKYVRKFNSFLRKYSSKYIYRADDCHKDDLDINKLGVCWTSSKGFVYHYAINLTEPTITCALFDYNNVDWILTTAISITTEGEMVNEIRIKNPQKLKILNIKEITVDSLYEKVFKFVDILEKYYGVQLSKKDTPSTSQSLRKYTGWDFWKVKDFVFNHGNNVSLFIKKVPKKPSNYKVAAMYEPDGHLSYYDYVKQAIREIWARGIPNNIENYWVNIYRDLITACISEGIEPKVCARMCYIKYHKENPQTKHLNDNLDVSFNTLKKEAMDYFKAVKKPLTYSDLRSAESTWVFYDNLKKKLKEYEHRRNIVGSFKEEVFEDNGIKYHFQRLSLKEAKHYIDDLITSNSWNDKTQFREIYDDSDIVNLYVEYNNGTKFDSSDGLMKNLKSTGIKNAIFEYESYTAYCGNDCHIEKFDEQQDAPYVVKCEASMLRKYNYKGNSIFASTKDEAIEILSSVLSKNVKKFCSLGQEESERLADYINNFEDSNLKRLYDKCLEASKVTQEFEEEAKKVIKELDKIHPSVRLAASSEEITAGLIWGVEGLEKLKKFGEVLFYIVNGVRYGVKPHRGAKHDIEWYYNQLKAGMEADKGYSVGLTQYLNAWIRKKELDVVFKGKA